MYICRDLETTQDKNSMAITTDSFADLFQDYWQRMYLFALKTTEDEEDAKEIVQDVFKSLWERREVLAIKDVERYLLRSVKLRTFEHIRNKVRRQKHHDYIRTESMSVYEEDSLSIKELQHKLRQIIDSLPQRCKHVFQMSRDQGLTNKEIAQQLLISERAVEYHISRALVTLREHFGKNK
ncbi:RNA polymerase sigma-70 factor [Sphingobacterium sp. UT-1RO-CII-1]|uniref:RNA polymerase sigma-70 factor n=1 Tax=Sphingobacterium sp. UT-1RO-CII-1 TaxID=2995225 RepID=UPI00227D0AED|nr:RNA polymerase sigma-70 factor [Sphingobacterium sp. UT-1RO-CII-1]MCY4781505.1 RNA polymerase sigma-70 factor [Sphingobacterium sp. UT-1RO-CII-1]